MNTHQGGDDKIVPFQESRELCHMCAKRRRRVVKFNLPTVITVPSGRRKIHICEYCLDSLDMMADDAIKFPNHKA